MKQDTGPKQFVTVSFALDFTQAEAIKEALKRIRTYQAFQLKVFFPEIGSRGVGGHKKNGPVRQGFQGKEVHLSKLKKTP